MNKLLEFVSAWEGFRENAYQDIVGVWTIGYGFTYGVKKGDTISREEADERLGQELAATYARLRDELTRTPSQQQADALVSLAYNVGVTALGESKTVKLFNEGRDQECADRFLLWCRAGGKFVAGLSHRRAAERAIYLNGDYSFLP